MYYGYFDLVDSMYHILGWVLFIMFIVWIVRGARGRHHSRWCDGTSCNHPVHGNTRAIDLLKERYAKGEIDTKEFEEKKKNLM
ncbi:MAG: SHOCT domain-containing protein [Candidatus Paceibacterota bacterium]